MNSDQILSALRTLLKVGGAALTTHGLMTDGHVQDIIGVIITLVGIWLSHQTHSDPEPSSSNPQKPPVQ